jgi:hypothetical protein
MAAPRGDPEREVLALLLTTNAQMVADVLRGPGDDPEADALVRAIAATRSLAAVVDDTLRALVDRARADGQTWARIGAALHVTRQAAFQRFGGDGEEGTPVADAPARALATLELFLDERFEQIRAAFDTRMTAVLPVTRLADARSRLHELGELRAFGAPTVSIRHGYTIVEVPMRFARGERLGQVALNGEGELSGLFILPAREA